MKVRYLAASAVAAATISATTIGLATAPPAGAEWALPMVATGQVLARDGAPQADARVNLVAWPSTHVLSALPTGATIHTRLLVSSTTDRAGHYALRYDLATLSRSFTEPDGTVNLEVDTASAGGPEATDHYSFSAKAASPTHQDTVRLAAAPSAESTFPVAPPDACSTVGWTAGIWVRHRPEAFLDVYSDIGGKATVTETSTASHTLGVGLRVDSGGWGIEGTASLQNERGASSTVTYQAGKRIFNQVNYRRFHRRCRPGFDQPEHTYREARPMGFYAQQVPALREDIGTQHWTNCTQYWSGSYSKTRGRNREFAGGVKLPFMSLSSTAAFSNSMIETFHITDHQYLCGSTEMGWDMAPQAGTRAFNAPMAASRR